MNEPYSRVGYGNSSYKEDGPMLGASLGMAAGAAGYYGSKVYNVSRMVGKAKDAIGAEEFDTTSMDKARGSVRQYVDSLPKGKQIGQIKGTLKSYQLGQNAAYDTSAAALPDEFKKTRKLFGRGRNRAITAGASILAGGLAGGMMDKAID